jgi:hypothetical protein
MTQSCGCIGLSQLVNSGLGARSGQSVTCSLILDHKVRGNANISGRPLLPANDGLCTAIFAAPVPIPADPMRYEGCVGPLVEGMGRDPAEQGRRWRAFLFIKARAALVQDLPEIIMVNYCRAQTARPHASPAPASSR